MALPLIGITTSRTINSYGAQALSLSEAYTRALTQAGGVPVLIPLDLPAPALHELVMRLDGLLFSGGGDMHPGRYGAPVHPLVSSIQEDRDQLEIDLLQGVVQRGLPFLGICRGLQVINVALGGSLYEDLLEQHPGALNHDRFPEQERDYLAHPVSIELDSRLHRILNCTRVEVNSMHHQGIRDLAPGLKPVASAPDGVIEAVELPDYPFGLAVQWHPECLPAHFPMQRLFREFVAAAGDRLL